MGKLQEILDEFARIDANLSKEPPQLLTESVSEHPSADPAETLQESPPSGNGAGDARVEDVKAMWDVVISDMGVVISTLERLRSSMVAAKSALEGLCKEDT